MDTSLALMLVLLALLFWYAACASRRRGCRVNSDCAAPDSCVAGRCGPAYGYGSSVASQTGVWDTGKPGAFVCPGWGSVDPRYCVVPAQDAPSVCSARPECLGYLKPGSGATWHHGYAGYAQLVAAQPAANADFPNSSYFAKALL